MIYFFLLTLLTCFAHGGQTIIISGPRGTEYILIDKPSTFEEAVANCSSLGATLPTVKTQDEVDFVAGYAPKLNEWPNVYHYLPLRAKVEKVDGKCVATWLLDGSEVTNGEWWYGSCDDGSQCVDLSIWKVWGIVPCSGPYLFQRTLCQKPSPLQTQESVEVIARRQKSIGEKIDSLNSNVNALSELIKKIAGARN